MVFAFTRAYPPAQPEPTLAYWFLFKGSELLLVELDSQIKLLQGEIAQFEPHLLNTPLYLGTLEGVPCLAGELPPEFELPETYLPFGLRNLYGRLDEPAYGLAGYASQMLHWQKVSRFCPACGQPSAQVQGDWGKRCPTCKHTIYPSVHAAVLALIHDGDNILLTHKAGWGNRYSLVAGFLEPGESLEDCVRREVYEEVGAELDEVSYYSSQTWPFPHQIMVAFFAHYKGGELRLDEQELDDAKWFHVDAMPELPGKLSLSRQVIDTWVASRR